ncbi:hypothetical protein BDF19DRAFT_435656 [Syncephalis fuscata]|nr:hypothetical protein BDF19DRAFT_435656 [Syncephalis fuscata]
MSKRTPATTTTTVLVLAANTAPSPTTGKEKISPPLLLSIFNAPSTFTTGLLPGHSTDIDPSMADNMKQEKDNIDSDTKTANNQHQQLDNLGTGLGKPRCAACGNLVFTDSQEQRAHFKLPFHIENVRRRLHQIGRPLTAKEYEFWLTGYWVESDGDTQYETCSEDNSTSSTEEEEEEEENEEEENEEEKDEEAEQKMASSINKHKVLTNQGTPMFWMQHDDYPNHRIGIYKQVALPQRLLRYYDRRQQQEQQEQQETVNITDQVLKWLKTARKAPPPPTIPGTKAAVATAIKATKTTKTKAVATTTVTTTAINNNYWTLILFVAGHFAGVVFDTCTEKIVAHKTFHKYMVRKKRGFAQATHDKKTGGKASSAGASLRRDNQRTLELSVGELLVTWRPLIDASERIFIRSSAYHLSTLFSVDSPIKRDDDRVRKIPFETKRPGYNEACHAIDRLGRFYIEPTST